MFGYIHTYKYTFNMQSRVPLVDLFNIKILRKKNENFCTAQTMKKIEKM